MPANNTVIEPELYGLDLEGVTFHSARVLGSLGGDSTIEGLKAVVNGVDAAIESLAVGGVDIIAYACLSTSLVNDDWEDRFRERVATIAGVPALTAFQATVDVVRALRVEAPLILTPYGKRIHELVEPKLIALGVHPVGCCSLEITGLRDVCRTPSDEVYRQARQLVHESARPAGALAIFATDLQTLAIHPTLRRDLNIPVVSTNQALIVEICRSLGIALPDAQPELCLREQRDRPEELQT